MRDFMSTILTPNVGYAELRAIKDGKVYQEFVPLDQRDAYQNLQEYAWAYDNKGYDVYYGVLRRTGRGGKALDVTDRAPVLWADIDPYKETNNQYGFESVLSFPIPASVIVDSGHGLHAYWLLLDAMPTGDATLAMKGIAKDIGGDHTHDSARVLRVPGTRNWKDPKNPIPVRLLLLDTMRRYHSSDFNEYVDKGGEGTGSPAKWRSDATPTPRRLDLPDWLAGLIQNGAVQGARSEACFKAMIWLLRYGWNHDQILGLFVDNPDGIGAKMYSKTAAQAQRWFDMTLKAAEAAA